MNILQKIIVKTIEFYQKILSPDHSFWAKNKTPYCKYIPSCSQYCKESIIKKWVLIGIPKCIWRILRCNPFSKWWHDPVE